jgi:hypothetical protein
LQDLGAYLVYPSNELGPEQIWAGSTVCEEILIFFECTTTAIGGVI